MIKKGAKIQNLPVRLAAFQLRRPPAQERLRCSPQLRAPAEIELVKGARFQSHSFRKFGRQDACCDKIFDKALG